MKMTMKKNDAVFLSKASYHTFGWLKRPEYDSDAGYAYEMPNGDLLFTDDPRHQYGLTLEIWMDKASGEKFCTLPKKRQINDARP